MSYSHLWILAKRERGAALAIDALDVDEEGLDRMYEILIRTSRRGVVALACRRWWRRRDLAAVVALVDGARSDACEIARRACEVFA